MINQTIKETKEFFSFVDSVEDNATTGNTTPQQAEQLLFQVSSHKRGDKEVIDRRTIKAHSRKQARGFFYNVLDKLNEWVIEDISLVKKRCLE